MFYPKDIQLINLDSFTIIRTSEEHIELLSKISKHYWLLRKCDDIILLFHKYDKTQPYHKQNNWRPFCRINDVMKYINSHDKYVATKVL